MAMVQKSKQWGHIPGVGRVLARYGVTTGCPSCLRSFSHNMRSMVAAGGGSGDDESGINEDVDEDEHADRDEKS
ncbi:hypothetical protein Tco_1572715 [Tanacetum coccineum]